MAESVIPRLDVMIATMGMAGLERTSRMRLPQMEGVRYLVSCQIPEGDFPEVPQSLHRDDVRVRFDRSRGVARNRNLLLDMWEAPLGMIADDDLDYEKEWLRGVIDTFDADPELGLASFMHIIDDGSTEKPYPPYAFDLRHPAKGYFPTAPEFALRREAVMKSGVRFNERFGVGAPHYISGEEDLFVNDLLRRGLKGWFFPRRICIHHGATTGIRLVDHPGVLRSQGAVLHRIHPFTALPRLLLVARRAAKASGSGMWRCLRHLLQGWSDGVLHGATLYDTSRRADHGQERS